MISNKALISYVVLDHFLDEKRIRKTKKDGSCRLIEKKTRNFGALEHNIVYVQFE